MNTPSHLIMTAAIRKAVPRWRLPLSAVLVGSVAPDVPLVILSFGAFAYFRYGQGMLVPEAFEHMFDTLYFTDPGWIAAHNFLHAPFLLLIGVLVCRGVYGAGRVLSGWWTWFLLSCLLHTLVDVFTHFDDGPVLLFPFDWSYRFPSAVSYWDQAHYGAQFFVFEVVLDSVLLVYVLGPGIVGRLRDLRARREAA